MTITRGRIRVEDGPKRVRAYFGGELMADSARVKLVWEKPYYPVYYFPAEDVRMEWLKPTDHTSRTPSRGTAGYFDLHAGGRIAHNAAYSYSDGKIEEIEGLVAFVWGEMDSWFEEDEEVFVHARDPYTRVDVLPSSRHIRVVVNGETVAESTAPRLLFETGLPTRYYLPKTDVRMDLLNPSSTSTHCPYKGTAQYWSVEVGGQVVDDIVWSYRTPVEESMRIAGFVSFYNEKVDIYVDGELEQKPNSVFS